MSYYEDREELVAVPCVNEEISIPQVLDLERLKLISAENEPYQETILEAEDIVYETFRFFAASEECRERVLPRVFWKIDKFLRHRDFTILLYNIEDYLNDFANEGFGYWELEKRYKRLVLKYIPGPES